MVAVLDRALKQCSSMSLCYHQLTQMLQARLKEVQTAFDARILSKNQGSVEASSFCLTMFNLLGLVKCFAEFLLSLLVKSGKAKPKKQVCKAVCKNNVQIKLTL